MGGQTNFTLGPIPGSPGEIYDLSAFSGGDIISRPAAVAIPFGVLCEVKADGTAQPVQELHASWPPAGAGATGSGTWLLGISVGGPVQAEGDYVPFAVPASNAGSTFSGYRKGQTVPFLKRGRIWMAFDGGGTIIRAGAFNVWHSSDGTHPQGVATFTAPSATAGQEIDVAPVSMTVWNPDLTSGTFTDAFGASAGILCVDINLPGYGS